jgi:hypothetical protein
MAVVTPRAIVWNTTAGAKTTGSFQPAAGELLVAVVGIAGNDTAPTMSDTDATITGWTLVDSFRSHGSAITGGLRIYVSNQGANGASITVTMTPTGDTGGGLAVLSVTDAAGFGASAVAGNGGQADQAAGTPAPVLDTVPHVASAMIIAVMTQTNGSANASPRTATTPDYTEAYDQGFNTPATGIEVQYLAGGETSQTLTTGGATPSGFAAIGIEIPVKQSIAAGVASEADSAPAATVSQPQAPVSGGVASEADSSPAATVSQPQAPVSGGVASEADSGLAATVSQPQAPVSGGVASEADSAPAATVDQGSGVFSPDDIASLACWLKADAISANDGDNVTTWEDSHTSNKDATGASGQTLETNEINGLPAVRFDGTDDRMDIAGILNNDATRTIFCVARYDTGIAGSDTTWSLSTGTSRIALTGGNIVYQLDQLGATVPLAAQPAVGEAHHTTIRFNSTTSADGWFNTTGPTNFDPNGNYHSGSVAMRLGATTGGGANFFDGYIAELLVFDAALTDTEVADVQAYLDEKWINAPQTINAGVATEADSVPAATVSQPQAPVSGGVASEANSANAATVSQPQAPVAAGTAQEADSANAATVVQPQAPVAAGTAQEADSVNAATVVQPQAPVAAGTASEADSAPAATVNQGDAQTISGGVAQEADSANTATVSQPQAPVAGGVASEADSAPAATVDQASDQTIFAGVASEADSVPAGTPTGGAQPPDTNPELGGVVSEPTLGGVFDESVTGGTFEEPSHGGSITEPTLGGVFDETVTGGEVTEPDEGAEIDNFLGGVIDEVLTNGSVTEPSINGNVTEPALNGAVTEPDLGALLDEAVRSSQIDEATRSGTPDESNRGGTIDEVLTGGEIF